MVSQPASTKSSNPCGKRTPCGKGTLTSEADTVCTRSKPQLAPPPAATATETVPEPVGDGPENSLTLGYGVTALDGPDAGPAPMMLVAATVKV